MQAHVENRRNIDLRYMCGNIVEDLVSLKIGSRNGKSYQNEQRWPYHPEITSMRTENFIDAEPRRLKAKLEGYYKLVEANFQHPESERILRRANPIVREELDRLLALRSEADEFFRVYQERLEKFATNSAKKHSKKRSKPTSAQKRKSQKQARKKNRR